MSPPFRPKTDLELDDLSDEDLIAYLHAARAGAEPAAARQAMDILVYGHVDMITARVRLKVPPHSVDLVVGKVLGTAMATELEGRSVGEFRSLLSTIVQRRIADFTRVKRPRETTLGEEHEGEEGVWGAAVAAPDPYAAVEQRDAIDRTLARRNPIHRQVIEGFVLGDHSAAETIDAIEAAHGERLSQDNVYKIKQRFGEDLGTELGRDTGTGP